MPEPPPAIRLRGSVYDHLLDLARARGAGRARVGEIVALAGLEPIALRRLGGLAPDESRRLRIAAALLDDPPGPASARTAPHRLGRAVGHSALPSSYWEP
jgi:ABC-type multidrug transport system ATPase subunit